MMVVNTMSDEDHHSKGHRNTTAGSMNDGS